jgi:hypothetical protein
LRRVLLATEDRCDRFAVDLLTQVLQHAVWRNTILSSRRPRRAVKPAGRAAARALLRSRRSSCGSGISGESKKLRIRPGAQARAAGFFGRVADSLQRFEHAPPAKANAVPPAITDDLDFEPRRQRVGHRDADAVQAAREAIRRFVPSSLLNLPPACNWVNTTSTVGTLRAGEFRPEYRARRPRR